MLVPTICTLIGAAIGFCLAASTCPPSYAAEAAELARLRRWTRTYDDRMDAAERSPDGDDYNELLSQIGRNP